MKSIVVTGVSTGIGKAITESLINNDFQVFGSVRKIEDAKKLKSEFKQKFVPLVFDVTDEKAIIENAELVKEKLDKNENLVGLINNAGIALGGPILLTETEVFRKQFEVNVMGVVSVIRAFSKLLGARKESDNPGKIINISSVSGKIALPFVAPYSASKHALEAISDSLRRELMLYGIDVILVEPGPVKTPIWDKTPDPENNPFIGTDYENSLREFRKFIEDSKQNGLPPEKVSNLILKILQIKNPKARYVITKNKFTHSTLPRLLPSRWLDSLLAKKLKLS
ncbi:MAG: SDR family oxidoreductase [Candidatus Marinimicrobia bacterium]|nr:SDR family oxidoreductase [Candidatus Neomarinimicrobiota bacterium]MBL7022478.1 SDR family oxidoreductase [Candidatus Neomarinimicrobiota bacterium]MBL7108667.1 SDR family oxidoreductase [Candidatus Neomarinimicrobiota bacterium]